jgi:predicted N-formylglutamate amidohydrolase
VLTCEHASNRLPFSSGVSTSQREVLATHRGLDIGAWDLTRDLSRRLNASAIGGRWSRLLVDLNRRADDPSLSRETADGVPLTWNGNLEAAEVERRITEYHTPYHVEIDRLILRRLVRGVRPLVFAVHSFTPDYHGRPRPFDIGVLYERHRALAHGLGRALRDSGLSVRYNQPYSGMAGMMYSVDRHGSHHRLPCLELEVNQALFERSDAAARLGRVVARGVANLLARTDRAVP